MTAIIQCLNIWSVFDPQTQNCQKLMVSYCGFYHSTKLSLYAIFVTTSYIVFYESAFRYNPTFIIICLIIIKAFGIFLGIGTWYGIEGVWLNDPVDWCHIHIRVGKWVPLGMAIWIFTSLFFYICSVILFTRPLISIIGLLDKSTKQALNKAKNSRVNNLIIKISILNGIAIISSFASLLVYLFTHISIVVDIDILITAACVLIATSRHHEELYAKLCKLSIH